MQVVVLMGFIALDFSAQICDNSSMVNNFVDGDFE